MKRFPWKILNKFLYAPYGIMIALEMGNCFFRNWWDMGIRVINDLISEEGIFYSFEQLRAKYNIRGTFLDYQH